MMILPSAEYMRYQSAAGYFITGDYRKRIDYPVNIQAIYYRKTKHRVDITNLESALMDVLVFWKVLVDDNSSIVHSTDGSRVEYDSKNPRTEIIITKCEV